MYAAIRQAKAKTGMAEELARRIKEGAIPIISDVEGFRAYYVVYAPDDTVTAISIFNDYAGATESNRRVLAWIEQSLAPLGLRPLPTFQRVGGGIGSRRRRLAQSRLSPVKRLPDRCGLHTQVQLRPSLASEDREDGEGRRQVQLSHVQLDAIQVAAL